MATWVTDPPIVRLEKADVKQVVATLKKNIEGFKTPGDTPAILAWNQRATDAANIANLVDFMKDAHADAERYYYAYEGTPVALIDMRKSSGCYVVDWLAAHPGAGNGGSIMIEHAVNVSQDGGCNGKLRLAATENAKGFYRRLGFAENTLFNLDPAASGEWSRPGGNRWRLTNAAQSFLA